MLKNISKKIIPMLLLVCLVVQVVPLAVSGANAQESVTKDGASYADVDLYSGNSSANLGDKVTANGAKYDITLDGAKVGSFTFNKNNQYIDITLTDNIAVSIIWNCASKYADCTLIGAGVYKIPQLVQDNGKTQSFNAIWIVDVQQCITPLDKFVGDYEGVYYLDDGATEVGLSLKVYKEEDNYYAIFKYFFSAENPTITGFFKMDVTYNDAKDQYELYAKEWLHRPQSLLIWWYMIDLKGKLTDDGVFYETESSDGYYFYFNVKKISINYEDFVGQYGGTYTAVGQTMGTVLNIAKEQNGEYMATFDYFLPQNPDVIVGSYKMQILYSETYGKITFVGERWVIEQPSTEFTHLDGSFDGDGFSGITARSSRINAVGTFDFTRILVDEII